MTARLRTYASRIVSGLLVAAGWNLHAEPIRLVRPEATFHAWSASEFASVIDGVPTGPRGWSTIPRVNEPQALVVCCERPVEADELDITLFFLAGRPLNAIADFALSFTTDSEPSLAGNWQPLEILRFSAEVTTLRRAGPGRLVSEIAPRAMTGTIPDDVYRVQVQLPGRRATGFRLDVFPVKPYDSESPGLSWHAPHDFSLTEFRVADHARETTNIALQKPVSASHPLEVLMLPGALTDGLPATIAHPGQADLGVDFWFEIDLGRTVQFDHFGLRTRGDGYIERFSRMAIRSYDTEPSAGAVPVWQGMIRADGSHPGPGEADIVRASMGKGTFRGRYLRISSDNPVPFSPQLAEVEVYETRRPEVVAAWADGREISFTSRLKLPPGTRRLTLQLRIPQSGMPPDVRFRWRLRGDLETWQESRLMSIDMPCPPPGKITFEAQAMHSDGQWDAAVYRLPVVARQHLWETGVFRWAGGGAIVLSATGLGILISRRRAARKLARAKAEAALANERSRIARDIHDDLGISLTQIAMQCEVIEDDFDHPEQMRQHVAELSHSARAVTRAVDEIVWAVTPGNDTLEKFTTFIGQFVQNCLRPTGLACRLALPAELPDLPMEATVRHHLYLVVREALNNIIRHARAQTVHFTLTLHERTLTLTLTDDGVGFDPNPDAIPAGERLFSGNGLSNMRKRMEEIGGTLEIISSPGHGTTLTLRQRLG
jgi:signal transduction histidine kinase